MGNSWSGQWGWYVIEWVWRSLIGAFLSDLEVECGRDRGVVGGN